MKVGYHLSCYNIIFLFVLALLSLSPQTSNKLSQKQAITLAEQFIVDNGYTMKSADRVSISYELNDQFESNLDTILKQRHNTIQSKAFGIFEYQNDWHVGFMVVGVSIAHIDSLKTDIQCRAVIVSKNGNEIRMAHKTIYQSAFLRL